MYSDPNSDLHQNRINSYLWYTQHIHQISSESVHNFLRYHVIYNFWPNLSMVKNHLKNYQIQIRIRIFTKIESILPCDRHNISTKFHSNQCSTFWDIVLYISLALSLNGEESIKQALSWYWARKSRTLANCKKFAIANCKKKM